MIARALRCMVQFDWSGSRGSRLLALAWASALRASLLARHARSARRRARASSLAGTPVVGKSSKPFKISSYMADLAGRVAVVTGASSGIGKAIGQALEERGMKVALVSRRSHHFPFDVSDVSSVERLKQKVEAELGVPSVVINNAGVFGPIANIADTDPAEWVETIQINTVGAYLVSRSFLAGMVSQGWGRVVNVSSAASLGKPGPGNSAYATSKVALNQFTRHLAAEMVGTGVTANVIHPGDVQTEMWQDIKNKAGGEGQQMADWVANVENVRGIQ